jgi:DNA polymerase III subunit alpha
MKHPITGFEHLHLHTMFSVLDGYGKVEEYAERLPKVNQKFFCISDHGAMGAVPRQIQSCEEKSLSPLFACEIYLNPKQPEVKYGESMSDYTKDMDPDERKKLAKSYHLLLIAHNEVGYSNLVQLSSWGWTRGFYYKPRINHEILMKHKEGLTVCSGCYNCEIGQAFEHDGEDAAMQMIEKYMAMFGEHFYLEIMLLDFKKQKPYDAFLIKAHEKYGIPLVITNDTHYCQKEDSEMQRYMLMIQTGKTVQDIQRIVAENQMADLFELQDQNLWLKSEEEINEKWEQDYSDIIDYEIFKQAKQNTVAIAEHASGVELDRSIKLPRIEDDEEKLRTESIKGFNRRNLPKTKKYQNRFNEEYNLICEKGFASYFLIQKAMVDEARRITPSLLGYGDGSEAVGPGRGSAAGSLICYCLGITDVNPITHDLLFSRFLSPSRGGKSMRLRFGIDPIQEKVQNDCPFDISSPAFS